LLFFEAITEKFKANNFALKGIMSGGNSARYHTHDLCINATCQSILLTVHSFPMRLNRYTIYARQGCGAADWNIVSSFLSYGQSQLDELSC
jgi:hypothetical protein